MRSFHLPHPRARELWASSALTTLATTVLRPEDGPLTGCVLSIAEAALLICPDEATFRRAAGFVDPAEALDEPHGGWIMAEALPSSVVLVELYPDDAREQPLSFEDPETTAAAAVDTLMAVWKALGEDADFRPGTVHVDGPEGGYDVQVDPDTTPSATRVARAWLDGEGDALACAARDAFAGLVELTEAAPRQDLLRGILLWEAGLWLERGVIDHARQAVAAWTPGQEEAEQAVVEAGAAWARTADVAEALGQAHLVEHPDGRRELRVIAAEVDHDRHKGRFLPLAAQWSEDFFTYERSELHPDWLPIRAWTTWLFRSLLGLVPSDPELPSLAAEVAQGLAEIEQMSLADAYEAHLRSYLLDFWVHEPARHPEPPSKVVDALLFLYTRAHQAGAVDDEQLESVSAIDALRDEIDRQAAAAQEAELGGPGQGDTLERLQRLMDERDTLRAEIKQLRKERTREAELDKKVEKRRKKRKMAKKTRKKKRRKKKKKR